jgi:hypothetical protein
LKSGSLNLLKPSGPVEACNGIALPLTFTSHAQNTTALQPNVFLTGIHRTLVTNKGRSAFFRDKKYLLRSTANFSVIVSRRNWVCQPLNPLNAELNPIRHLLALAGAHHFVDVSRIRVNVIAANSLWNLDKLRADLNTVAES